MIKKIIKISLVIFFILVLIIFYLSFFGIKTNKLNSQIINNISKINEKINLDIGEVNYLLDPYNFSINIKTKNPQILIEGRRLEIKDIQTNVDLKSLINNQISIDDLKLSIKKIKLNDVISLARVFQNSPQLFVIDTIIKDGLVTANISLKFDELGRVIENYKIEGSIEEAKLNIISQYKLKNLNFNFKIDKSLYSLKQIGVELNGIEITSPMINIKKKKNSFSVNGQFLNEKKNFDIKKLKSIFVNLFDYQDIQKVEFSSKNNFSFNVNKNLKFNNFKIESIIYLNKLIINQKDLKLKPFFPSFVEEMKLKDHKIVINYNKDKFDISGNGNISLEDKVDIIEYKIIKNNFSLSFDSKIELKNNSLVIDFLDYKKKERLSSLVSIKGNLKKDNQLRFDLINIKEKNNEITVKGLDFNKDFKIIDIESFNINYMNNKNNLNKLNLKKDSSIFIIEGESFDASKIINDTLDGDEKGSSIFYDLNSKIDVKIKKTYIDEINYINNLNGNIDFNNNKINELKLDATFPNKKKINLSIKTKSNLESITKLSSNYPKPLIKRYNFIRGFEEGNLNFFSSKKGQISNSVLVIDNFKVKEVPVFAKLLSLASLQGVADLLTGEGIRFTDFEMNFSSQKGLTTIEEMYAIGPAVSILMDGYIESKKLVSLRGTLVPATTINRTISSIPLLGKILIGDKTGEGVFGVSFKIKGSPKDLKTTVNPIKSLTPRFITRTLEKIKKN
jgi:hypothetical protein